MASVMTLPMTLSTPSSSWKKPAAAKSFSAPAPLSVYPAGPSYISSARRQLLGLSFAEDDAIIEAELAAKAESKAKENGEELYPGLGEEKEDRSLLELDAKEWKKQDHYAVLGLGKLRYFATIDQIQVAHRRKVLRHHPDKKAAQSGANDDSFFKCIQKAFDVLMDKEKRRQFDSVDPAIEDEVPSVKTTKPEDFCKVYGPVFAREGRFSKKQPVPGLGAMDASKAEVEGFYDFWYNFDSWRSFEWHDKEANEGSDSRDEKRFTEKKNKADRARLKKEDNTRLRELVDLMLANDPRIKRIKAEEKAARDAKKGGAAASGAKGKPMTLAQKKEEAAKKAEEEKKRLEEEKKKAEEEKGNREAAKKAKEAAKKNLKKWKKAIATVVSTSNYFQPTGTQASASVVEKQLAEIDSLCEVLEPEEVKTLKEEVEKAGAGEAAKAVIVKAAKVAEGKEGGAGKFTEFA